MRTPSMPADLRERYGPVVPDWELRARPISLLPRARRTRVPDSPEVCANRRQVLLDAFPESPRHRRQARSRR